MEIVVYDGEIYHHGVKGMKWGVRRYMNEDGTLTDAGKKRYRNANKTVMKADPYEVSKKTIKALPRKQRKDTERYVKDSKKSYLESGKKAYKDMGGRKGRLRIAEDEFGNYFDIVSGKKVNPETVAKVDAYLYNRQVRNSRIATAAIMTPFMIAAGAEFVSNAISLAEHGSRSR